MHRITLTIILLFSATCADADWYQKTDGSIVYPIQERYGGEHWYSGNNLYPGAYLQYASLSYADLTEADLSGANLFSAYLNYADLSYADLSEAHLERADLMNADLMNADLRFAELREADLTNADLTDADLRVAWLTLADLSGANLSGSNFSNVFNYVSVTWTDAFYYTDNEPTWHSGMDAAWRASEGILALAPTNAVPEPCSIALLSVAAMGLCLVARGRRNR